MALAVLSTSSLPHDPSWDESIVPTLRKRLEHESQTLSKRMSAASMTSDQDVYSPDNSSSNAAFHARNITASPSLQNAKPSSIPRPSLQHGRAPETPTSTPPLPGSQTRTRTISQPFPFEPPLTSSASYPLPDFIGRSDSPMSTAVKSTRIPVSRSRTGSMSSHKQPSLNGVMSNGRADTRNGSYKANGHAYQTSYSELRAVNEGQLSSASSRSTMKTPRTNGTDLAGEPAPFYMNSSRSGNFDDFASPRMSNDSEERPFEHWYRGDVSRNGGVGELRVGRRQEMLDIAFYGHTLRQATSQAAFGMPPSRSRSNSRGRESPRRSARPRSGSLGTALGRASIYIDNQAAADDGMVFDEKPLTDLDSDEGPPYDNNDGEEEYIEEDITQRMEMHRDFVASPVADRSDTPSTLVDATRASAFKSRIPTPTVSRQATEQPETPTPTQSPTLNAVDPPPVPSKITPLSLSQGSSTPTPKATVTSAVKSKAKSPATRAKAKTAAKPPPKKQRENGDRASIAQYPSVDADDIVHAIPTWTQPVPPSGNWDEVVLPVVARKKGLEGQYVQADGSPRPIPKSNVVEPAPGTFGYDPSKYRPPRDRGSAGPEFIQMNEFGEPKPEPIAEQPTPREKPMQLPPSPIAPMLPVPRGRSPMRPESPAPFSHYANEPVPSIRVTRPSQEGQRVEVTREEDAGSGCCKCIVM